MSRFKVHSASLPGFARAHLWTVLRAGLSGVLTCLLATAPGCWMFTLERTSNKPILPPLVPPKDAIALEVFFVDRPAGDPLLGATLWRQLDEINVVDSTERARLRAAGVRVGSAGSNPPQTLRAAAAEQRSESAHGGRPQRLTLLAGDETTLESAIIDEQFVLRTVGINGETTRAYPGARCVLRVSGERVQDGWVRLSIQPEVHYGPSHVQRTANDGDWKLRQGQKVDPLLEQRFDVEMHVGELIVIGAADNVGEDSVGRRFFRTGAAPAAHEHVIVLRVENLQQIKGVRSQ